MHTVYLVAFSGGGGLPRRGVYTTSPPHPLDRILDTCLWKHYLPSTTVAGGKNALNAMHSSFQVVVVKLKMDKDRKRILERKARSRTAADKGKHTEETIMETS